MIIKGLLAFDLLIVNCEYFIIHSRQGFSLVGGLCKTAYGAVYK